MFLLLMDALISFGICSTQNHQIKRHHYHSHAKQPNEFQYQSTHQDLLYTPYPLFFLNYLEKKHH